MQFEVFQSMVPNIRQTARIKNEIKEYAELVGKDCAYEMLYYIDWKVKNDVDDKLVTGEKSSIFVNIIK